MFVEKLPARGIRSSNNLAKAIYLLIAGMLLSNLLFGQKPLSKKEEKLKEIHRSWINARIVAGGDTLHVRIKPNKTLAFDYMISVDMDLFNAENFIIAFDNDKEKKITTTDYAEILIPQSSGGIAKYVSIITRAEGKKVCTVYRVMQDGMCQLLFAPYNGVITNDGDMMMAYKRIGFKGKVEVEDYWLYYKKELWQVTIKTLDLSKPIITSEVRDKLCEKIFSDCPALANLLQQKAFLNNDLMYIVNEFNNCLLVSDAK